MQPTILTSAALPSTWMAMVPGVFESSPPPAGISVIHDGFMLTSPSPLTSVRQEAGLSWLTYDSRPPLDIHSSIPPASQETIFIQRDWELMQGALLNGGLAQRNDEGVIQLLTPIRVKGIGISSRPLKNMAELRWLIERHGADSRIFGGLIEAAEPGWQDTYDSVFAVLQRLTDPLHPLETEADRGLYRAAFETAGRIAVDNARQAAARIVPPKASR